MTWVAWRQFRTSAIVAAAALAVVAVLLALTTLHSSPACALQACLPDHGRLGRLSHDNLLSILSTFVVAAPAVVGIFWGAPLIARELEAGTYRLAWTQGVTRSRWLATRLLVVGVAGATACGLFSGMLAWWSSADVERGRLAPSMFAERGIVPIGYAVFALALGIAAGVLIRRTLPAMAATLVGFVASRMVVQFLVRAHLLPVRHLTSAITANTPMGISLSEPSGSISLSPPHLTTGQGWVVSNRIVNSSGHGPTASFLNTACAHAKALALAPPTGPVGPVNSHKAAPPEAMRAFQQCIGNVGKQYHVLVAYQPNSHYWGLQGIETAIFLAAAAILVGLTFWGVRRRLT
jgi:ABC-type transport system involved in multi-copper enzyme maturation permease subunit